MFDEHMTTFEYEFFISLWRVTCLPTQCCLIRIIPLYHINGLEPGESWTTTTLLPTSLSPFFANRHLPATVPQSSSESWRADRWAVLQQLLRNKRFVSSTTVIEVRFDHEDNR